MKNAWLNPNQDEAIVEAVPPPNEVSGITIIVNNNNHQQVIIVKLILVYPGIHLAVHFCLCDVLDCVHHSGSPNYE